MTRRRFFARVFPIALKRGLGIFAASLLAACGGSASPGIVTGIVTYDGRPAAGKRIQLAGGENRFQSTDANGRYTFSNVTSRRHQIIYRSESDNPRAIPNEVAEWRSLAFELSEGSGKEVPTFDVAYNGVLYPDEGMALIVNEEALVPFHWSTHPQARNYRVRLEAEAGGFRWLGPWGAEPTAVFGQSVNTGRYRWMVEIDGGDAGVGVTRQRQVDF